MRKTIPKLFMLVLSCTSFQKAGAQLNSSSLDFFGEPILLPVQLSLPVSKASLPETAVAEFIQAMDTISLQPFLHALLHYKKMHNPDDWLYYQLVRKVAQYINPKTENYYRYTFYKWWFLVQSGYNARLTAADNYLLFYVQSDESIYNIPARMIEGKQYVCLNYHDYGFAIDFEKHAFSDITPFNASTAKPFSYKVNRLPEFSKADYTEKDFVFSDGMNQYSFRIKVNPQVKTIFTNYPVVDYDLQFNMPLSKPTYESLIPSLKKHLKGMKPKDGVEFLTRFTRYAFLFKPDREAFGNEKRLTPEQTLLYDYSDCEDRAALFFLLVKEIYNLPMLVLTYPEHVTVAVQLEKPYGQTIEYMGMKYTVCEPSPQRVDLRIGQTLPELSKATYQVAYAYHPSAK